MDMQSIPMEQHYVPYRAAGFWMRFWAYIVDLIIVFALNGIVFRFVAIFGGNQIVISNWTLTGVIGAITFFIYFVLMTKFYGQTLGKMIFGLKVVHENDAGELSWLDVVFREVVGRFIYKSFVILNLLYIVVAFNKDKQGLHDMFGETRVIHTF